VDLGQATGILAPEEQIRSEGYNIGTRLNFYISAVRMGSKGPEIILSRTHPEIVKELFATEVPEIAAGTVEIKSIAREAGARTKIAVFTSEENIDPIGSCVGQRGARVQTVINELGGEKIDIIHWNSDPKTFIANSLSPASIGKIEVDEENKTAKVMVNDDQLSLAIGRGGQNARLAAKLTGWKIDIISPSNPDKNPNNNTAPAKKADNEEIETVVDKNTEEADEKVEEEKVKKEKKTTKAKKAK
jgi:N utilization substance protein A